VPLGPTFASIGCQLDALRAATTAAGPAIGKLEAKAQKALDKADLRLGKALEKCGAGDEKRAASELKKLIRKLIRYAHMFRSNSARKKIPEEVREPLAQGADDIQPFATTLRDTLACPEDAS
jgi:hypothetical protein